MTNSIEEFANAECIFVIGSNTTEAHPVISYYMKQAVKKGALLIVNDPRNIDLTRWATHHVAMKPGTDVAYLNGLMREIIQNNWHDKAFIEKNTEKFEELRSTVESYTLEKTANITGVPEKTIVEVSRLLGAAKMVTLAYTLGITEHTSGVDNVRSCANLQLLLGNIGQPSGGVNPLRGQNNVQGACDIGALPDVFPGYLKVNDQEAIKTFENAWGVKLDNKIGKVMPEMLSGCISGDTRALYIYGENLALSEPNLHHTRECLEKCEFIVVSDIFQNDTSQYADVVLPDLSWAEEDGTFTNTERRVQRVRSALKPPDEARSHWKVMNELSQRMGKDLGLVSPDQMYNEIRELIPSYKGITWERIENCGIQWPCPTVDHPGTPILHRNGHFSRGKGLFAGVEYRPPAEIPNEEYPFYLSTGRRLWHYHTVQTHHCVSFDELFAEELLEIHPADAKKLDIATGDLVQVISRRGSIKLKAWVTNRSREGICWTTFHFPEVRTNDVTNDALDPISSTAEYKVCAIRVEKLSDGSVSKNAPIQWRSNRP